MANILNLNQPADDLAQDEAMREFYATGRLDAEMRCTLAILRHRSAVIALCTARGYAERMEARSAADQAYAELLNVVREQITRAWGGV